MRIIVALMQRPRLSILIPVHCRILYKWPMWHYILCFFSPAQIHFSISSRTTLSDHRRHFSHCRPNLSLSCFRSLLAKKPLPGNFLRCYRLLSTVTHTCRTYSFYSHQTHLVFHFFTCFIFSLRSHLSVQSSVSSLSYLFLIPHISVSRATMSSSFIKTFLVPSFGKCLAQRSLCAAVAINAFAQVSDRHVAARTAIPRDAAVGGEGCFCLKLHSLDHPCTMHSDRVSIATLNIP